MSEFDTIKNSGAGLIPAAVFPVLERGKAILFPEYVLKVRLAGEAEIAADVRQAFGIMLRWSSRVLV